MSLIEDIRNLDPRDPGRWPLAVRMGAVAVVFVVLAAVFSYFFVYTPLDPQLQQLAGTEQQLRNEFRTKHSKATNLEIYKQQLADIEKSFGAMLRQLPSKTEVDNLLVDISQTGLASALEQKLFQPQAEQKKDFYAERPIKIRFVGSYHQFGQFVSGVAALPRIVTLHDVQIAPVDKSAGFDRLQMDLTAKTYRYLDDEEVAAAEADRRKVERAKRTPAGAAAGGG
jgi:type IV pilus assembly protein PilO